MATAAAAAPVAAAEDEGLAAKQKLAKAEAELEVAKAEVEVAKAKLADTEVLFAEWEKKPEAYKQATPYPEYKLEWEKKRDAAQHQVDAALKQIELIQQRDSSLLGKKRPVLEEPDSEFSKFVQASISRQKVSISKFLTMDPNAPEHERILQLHSKLNGRANGTTKVYLRRCYKWVREEVQLAFSESDPIVLIAGTRGIGKSVFGTISVMEYVAQNEIVLYRHMRDTVLIFSKDSPREGLASLEKALGTALPEPGVYQILDEHLINVIMDIPSVISVLDLGDSTNIDFVRTGGSRWLVISSANSAKLKSLRNVNVRIIVMPLWTVDELLSAREISYKDEWVQRKEVGYTEEEVKSRFENFGGVPRWVLDRPKDGTEGFKSSEVELTSALVQVTMEELVQLFKNGSYIDLPAQSVSGILVHIVEGKRSRLPTAKFASEQIRRMLAAELMSSQRLGVAGFLNAVRNIPELGGYVGWCTENYSHRTIPEGHKVSLRPLGGKANFSKFRVAQMPKCLATVSFKEDNLSDLLELQQNQYVMPTKKNFDTVDSFMVTQLNWIDPKCKTDELCLVTFQVTIASSHSVHGGVLKRILAKVKDLLKVKKLSMIHMFVSGANGIRTAQTITNSSGAEYANELPVAQYVVHLGDDFEKLFESELRRAE